jgi:hypothetical protein
MSSKTIGAFANKRMTRRRTFPRPYLCLLTLLSFLLSCCRLQFLVDAQGRATTSHRRQRQKMQPQNQQKHTSSQQRRLTKEERRQEYYSRFLTNEVKPRIFGGWDTVEDRYPYAQVSLYSDSEGHQCGASLIAVDVVLTAAHCAGSYDYIIIGKHKIEDTTDEAEIFAPLMEIVHPENDETTTRFDVMLIILDGYTTLATPVRVNNNSDVPTNGQDLTVLGFGYDESWEMPDMLQETKVAYTRNLDCVAIQDENGYTLENDLYADMLCAGEDGRDSCYGDSGSPLILVGNTVEQDVQVGLVSWGYECAGDLPGIYSRLSHWQTFNFIKDTVCEHSVSPPTTYMNCGQQTTATTNPPTHAPPTAGPTYYPTYYPTLESTLETIPPPTIGPTTAALQDFLQGTSAANVDNKTEPVSVFDDAYYFDGQEYAGNVNKIHSDAGKSLIVSFALATSLTAALIGLVRC